MIKNVNLELRENGTGACSTTNNVKKNNRSRSFHFRYLELCRAKNLTPLAEIRSKSNANTILDFYGDKLSVTDWLLVVEALYYDQVLQNLSIHMRKTFGMVLEHLDTEKKAKLFRQRPVLYTKFVFSGIVEAVSNCIEYNRNIRVLCLEGLPLNDKYIEAIAKAMAANDSLKEVSFQRSNIYDKGCEAICNTIKYLANIEKLNLSECELTTKGAEYVADMIKVQKISRYTEGWQQSLRYREVDPETIPGIRAISLSRNHQIGDDGLKPIVEVLKEDVWIKVIDMEACGLSDRAANMILDCLEINHYIADFNVRNNNCISKFLQRSIRDQLGKEDEDARLVDGQVVVHGPNGTIQRQSKMTLSALKEQLKTLEEQLAFERVLRKKAEQLNERLNQQIVAYENQLESDVHANIPEGYVVVKNDSLQSIIKERNDFQKLAANNVSNESTPRTFSNRNMEETCSSNEMDPGTAKNITALKEMNLHHPSLDSGSYDYATDGETTDRDVMPIHHTMSPRYPGEQLQQQHLQQLQLLQQQQRQLQLHQQQLQQLQQQEQELAVVQPQMHHYHQNETKMGEVQLMTSKELRKSMKIRKVKSEMKYVETPTLKDATKKDKKKESKSDHEFANDSDVAGVHFEKNIGDTLVNISDRSSDQYSDITLVPEIQNLEEYKEKLAAGNLKGKIYTSSKDYNKTQYYEGLNRIDLEELSIPTTRSFCSDIHSSDSDTLRNEYCPTQDSLDNNYQPIKVITKRSKSSNDEYSRAQQNYNGEGGIRLQSPKSPRSLFLGLQG